MHRHLSVGLVQLWALALKISLLDRILFVSS